jgi:succinate dehydrogenase hydrophobic anchor subunit
MILPVMLMRCTAILLVALGIYMLVDGFTLLKMLYDPLLWVECLSFSFWVLMAVPYLICVWKHVLFIWDQRSIYHHECLAYMLPCGEA